jgi:hypothetical protein
MLTQVRGGVRQMDIHPSALGAILSPKELEWWDNHRERVASGVGKLVVIKPSTGPHRIVAGIITGQSRIDFSRDWESPGLTAKTASLRVTVDNPVGWTTVGRVREEGHRVTYPTGELTLAYAAQQLTPTDTTVGPIGLRGRACGALVSGGIVSRSYETLIDEAEIFADPELANNDRIAPTLWAMLAETEVKLAA